MAWQDADIQEWVERVAPEPRRRARRPRRPGRSARAPGSLPQPRCSLRWRSSKCCSRMRRMPNEHGSSSRPVPSGVAEHQHGDHRFTEADWAGLAEHAEREGELFLNFVTDTAQWVGELRGFDAPPVRRVLDIGSGPGVGTCELARMFPEAHVVAVDGSPAMLDHTTRRAAAHGLDRRISTHLAELPDGLDGLEPADVIWASLSLHHVGDETTLAPCAARSARTVRAARGRRSRRTDAGPARRPRRRPPRARRPSRTGRVDAGSRPCARASPAAFPRPISRRCSRPRDSPSWGSGSRASASTRRCRTRRASRRGRAHPSRPPPTRRAARRRRSARARRAERPRRSPQCHAARRRVRCGVASDRRRSTRVTASRRLAGH